MHDPFALEFVRAIGGGIDFGVIDAGTAAACGVAAAPIRLQQGYPGGKGFGNRHVESYKGRMGQLKGLGFDTFARYACEVGRGFDRIERCEDSRLRLVLKRGTYDYSIVVQYDEKGFWSIVTGLPYAHREKDVILRVR